MNFTWLETLLPRAVLNNRNQIWWALFFLLFPLAYLGGIKLETIEEASAMMSGYQDRAASIRTAAEFADSKGFPVTGWHEYVVANKHENLLAYYGDGKDPVLAAASNVAPGEEVQVLFRSPDQSHEFRTYLSLTGHVTGYDFGKSRNGRGDRVSFGIASVTTTTHTSDTSDADDGSMKNAIRNSDMEAEDLARQALDGNTALRGLVQLGKPRISTTDDDSSRHEVTWEASPAGKPDLKLKIQVGVRDSQVVAEHITATLDKDKKSTPGFRVALLTLYGTFLFFGAFYAMFRYAKRTLQKEVSHLRTLVVGAIFTITYTTMAYSVAVDQVAVEISGETFSKFQLYAYIPAVITFALMGLLVGIGYGSGEGEVREAYPGKLTSLDALLVGRIFSRDVGASLLFGTAAAGWLLLGHQAFSYFLRNDVLATRSDVLEYTFSRIPWLTLLVGRQYHSLLVAVTGLLLPAGFLLRRTTVRKSRRFLWLIVFAVLSVLYDASKFPDWASALLAIAVLTCALLLPFFAYDLLAAMVAISTLLLAEQLIRLSAIFPSWNNLAGSLASTVGLGLIVATWLALRGRSVNEDEVQPQYAKNLTQRMSLQAEVLAAREAQLRLLPQAVPEMPGIQFAACCLPARGVGGDFYDFFRLDANRVGIFVAQGGDQGLASALCIALAKGVLMHSSLQPNSPTQTLLDLEASIGELLEGGSAGKISFAYGVIDTLRNTLSYARVGDSPKLLIYREGQGIITSSQLERVVPVDGRFKGAATINEGHIQTTPGDFLIFFTKGLTSLKPKRLSRREYQWLDLLTPYFSRTEEPLQTSLTQALSKYQHQAADDLTAVVLRMVQRQALVKEVVA